MEGDDSSVSDTVMLKERLRQVGLQSGLLAVGFTSAEPFPAALADLNSRRDQGLSADIAFTYRNPVRSTTIRETFPWANSIIVGAWPYPAASPHRSGAEVAGAMGAYVWDQHYEALRAALDRIGDSLRSDGWRAQIVSDDNALMDRAAAVRAGLGWWGKNTNVLVPGYGSWFVIGSVVTDVSIDADPPVDTSCGPCRRCLDGCPTQAIIEPGVLDARRCLAWLVQSAEEFPLEFRAALGGRIYGCDDCQLVCPPNRHPGTAAADVATSADLDMVLDGTDEEILDHFGSWYIPRRQARYVRRNALIAWANTVDPHDAAIEDRIRRYLFADDPMLVAYAIWAARRLGRQSMVDEWDPPDVIDDVWRKRWERERSAVVAPRSVTILAPRRRP